MSTYFKQDFFDVINLWCKQIRGYSNWCLGSSCDSNKTPYFSTHSGKIKPLSQWYKSKAFSWTFFMYWTIFYLLQKHCLNHSIKGGAFIIQNRFLCFFWTNESNTFKNNTKNHTFYLLLSKKNRQKNNKR